MSAAVLPIMDASGDNYYHAHRSRGATAATRRMPGTRRLFVYCTSIIVLCTFE